MKLLSSPRLIVQFGLLAAGVHGQDLLNVDFGENSKVGVAATGRTASDRWNGFTFPSQQSATISNLIEAGGTTTPVTLTLENGGGYWGNTTGDAMYDGYVYPNSGLGDGIGNLTVTISNLAGGEYDLYLYGHADPFGRGECNTMFSASSGGNSFGPVGTTLSAGWTTAQPWEEGKQYVLFRKVQVGSAQPLVIVGEPGYNGQPSTGPDHPPILNGIQIQKSVAPFANGSFESPAMSPGFGQALPDGSTAITGWTIAGSGIGWQNGASFGVNPSEGLQHIGFNGGNEAPGASIFQTFATTAGQSYRVSFDLGRVGPGDGVVGLLATVTSGTGVVLGSLAATAPDSPGYGPARSFTFTATGPSSTLAFLDTSIATIAVDPLLDNVSVTSSPACVTAPSDLIGWWRGNANATDEVTTSQGTMTGGVSFTGGEAGQAFDFDGIDSRISLGNSVGNFETSDFTVEFWIRTTATRHESIIEKRPICGYESQWEIRIGSIAPWSGPGRLEAATISDNSGNDLNAISAGRAINDGLFHHVALVRAGTNLVFYVDGTLDVATNVLSGTVSRINNTADLTVGNGACVGVDGTSPFTGQLDEMSIYHRALSPAEIQGIYDAGGAGKCLPTPLPARALAHWTFDETSGISAQDSAGTYDGTLSATGARFDTNGVSGGAISLSKASNGYVNMGNVLGMTAGDFSLVAWVKTAPDYVSECSDIITKHEPYSANGYLLEINACGTYAQPGKAWFYDSDNVGQELPGTTTVNDGLWHQVVAVYQAGGNKYIYVDGAPSEGTKTSLAIAPNDRPFLIGGVAFGEIPTSRFTGLIDDVQVYNYALVSSEVDFLFHNPGQEVPAHQFPPAERRLETIAGAGGTITRDPDLPRYSTGSAVTLTAVPGAGFAFVSWSGDASGTNNPLTVTMSGNKTIIASFRQATPPERVLAVVSPGPVQEGLSISVPVQLTSGGEVGGMSFVVRYDTNYVSDPELEWSGVVGSALNQVNYDVPGEVRGTFALPATAVPAGVQSIGTVGFRTRSVPFSLTTDLGLEILDVSRPTGDAIASGSAVQPGSAQILVRRVIGDNNANDSLDVGDATIIQRLTAGLDPVRSWDVTGNDVNANTKLDSGDVIKVMRVVVGLDAQPQPQGVTAGQRTIAKAGPRKAGGGSGSVALSLDKVRAQVGELVTLQVRLAGLSEPLAGASFTVDYPTNALRLLNTASCRVGPLVPGTGTGVALWNVAPGQNNFPGQTGRVKFGASSANAWPGTNGLLAELVFEAQGTQTGRYLWPITVSEAAAADGYDPIQLAATQINFIGRDQVPLFSPIFGSSVASIDGKLEMTLNGEPGVLYDIEVSTDLTHWALLMTATGGAGPVTIVDADATNHPHRFYRAKAQ